MNSDPTPINTPEDSPEQELRRLTKEMGRIVVFRVMHLEGREDVTPVGEHGWVEYIVNNLQHTTEGDYVFHGDSAHLDAAIHAHPYKIRQVHAVVIEEKDLILKDDRVGYIKNEARALALNIPHELVESFHGNFNDEPTRQALLNFALERMASQNSEE